MNAKRREALKEASLKIQQAIDMLNEAKESIDEIQSEEEEAYENLPESFQESDRGETMQENIFTMGNVRESIEDQVTELEDCLLSLDTM